MLLIMIPDQCPIYYKALEIYTGYFDSLDIMILFSYPSSIVITRDNCMFKPCTTHDLEVMSSSPDRVKLGVQSTSVCVKLEPKH